MSELLILREKSTCYKARLKNISTQTQAPYILVESEANILTPVHHVNICPSASQINSLKIKWWF